VARLYESSDGRFSFKELVAGTHRLSVRSDTGVSAATSVVIAPEVATGEVLLQLQPGAVIELAGGGQEYGRLSVRDANDAQLCNLPDAAFGEQACVLEPGRFVVVLGVGGRDVGSYEISLAAGERQRFRLPLP
jgi:hypothetical protein